MGVANPEVIVEVGAESYDAVATPLEGDEHDREFAEQVSRAPQFGEYQKQIDRIIPDVALTRS